MESSRMEMVRTEGGLIVPEAAIRPAPPPPPQMLLLDGVPVPIALFGTRERGASPRLIPLDGWVWEVRGVNPWSIQLRLRTPTAKMLKKLGQPEKLEGGDIGWTTK